MSLLGGQRADGLGGDLVRPGSTSGGNGGDDQAFDERSRAEDEHELWDDTMLIVNTAMMGVIIGLFALADRDTPLVAIVLLSFLVGSGNSMQFSSMNSLAFADIDARNSSMANTMASTMQQLSMSFGLALGLDGAQSFELGAAALLHDIGKTFVPQAILDKPGKLDAEEWAIVKQHPAHTLSVLERVPAFREFAIDSANHHEWIDGQGYCRGLTGDALSTTARILAVADVVDALSADRPYRAGMAPERVRAIIESEAGTLFDRVCVDVCDAHVLERTHDDDREHRHVA